MFTAEQFELFHTVGYVRLDGAVPTADVAQMHNRVWKLLEKRGEMRDAPSTWVSGYSSKLQTLKHERFKPDDSAVVSAALDAVFAGNQRQRPTSWGQHLVTFPHGAGPWLLPHNVWHFDHPYLNPGKIWGVNVFLLIDDVEPQGGGTVVVRSSPLLMDRMLANVPLINKHSVQNKAFLQSHSWLRGLKTRKQNRTVERNNAYMARDTDIDGIATRVVELTGKAGDVFLSHPALCHAPAPNVSNRPRMMRTQRVRLLRNGKPYWPDYTESA